MDTTKHCCSLLLSPVTAQFLKFPSYWMWLFLSPASSCWSVVRNAPKLYINAVFQLSSGHQTPQSISLGWQQVPPGDVLLEVVGSLGRKLPFSFPLVLQNGVAGPLNVSWAGLQQSLGAIQSWGQVFNNFSLDPETFHLQKVQSSQYLHPDVTLGRLKETAGSWIAVAV